MEVKYERRRKKIAISLWAIVLSVLLVVVSIFIMCGMINWMTGISINFWVMLLSSIVTGIAIMPIKVIADKLTKYAKKGGRYVIRIWNTMSF